MPIEPVIGAPAPDFRLPASSGQEVSLADFRGKSNVLLYFYPKDLTPGCTTQACDLRDQHRSFDLLDTVILGVSPDPLKQHAKFIEKHGLPFVLLADEEQKASMAYGVWKEKKNYGKTYMGIERSTFFINKEGVLVKEWRKVKVAGHIEDALQFIKEYTGQ